METLHLLNFKVQGFDLFVFAVDRILKVAFFLHHLFHVDTSVLKKLSMGDMSQWGFGGMSLDLFLAMADDIFIFLLDSIMIGSKLSQSQLIISSLIQSILYLSG